MAPHSDQESYAEAKRYLDAKEYTKALPLLITAANAGNTESMYKLGDLYRNGSDVAPDYKKALIASWAYLAHRRASQTKWRLSRKATVSPAPAN